MSPTLISPKILQILGKEPAGLGCGPRSDVTDLSSAQEIGPIQLDQGNIKEQIHDWIQADGPNEIAQGTGESAGISSTGTESSSKTEAELEPKKTRARTRPGWLKDFIRLERS